MYNNTSYEEYMRNVLGYTPSCMQDTFATNDYYIMQNSNECMENSNLNELFPDMYRKVYPLVCKECSMNTMPVTNEILEQMTDNVLNQIDIDPDKCKNRNKKRRFKKWENARNKF